MKYALLVWLLVATAVGATGVLRASPLPLPALGLLITGLLLSLIASSPAVRYTALAGGVRPLIAIHLSRFVGFYFLWLYGHALLPREFAVPAGWGDIAVAAAAIPVLSAASRNTPASRRTIALWNIAGLLDIVFVMANAFRMVPADPLLEAAFTSLPLALLPTFLVPLIIVTHVLIFVWLSRQGGPGPARG